MIAVITYDRPHRKTQDLLCRLLLSGYLDVDLLVLPYVERSQFKPLFPHRPSKAIDRPIMFIADIYHLTHETLIAHINTHDYEKVLIGGAGIIPHHDKIINAHPGFLPNVRGLDALKWAILEGQPIGVTTYQIGEEVDTGKLIEQRIIQLRYTDSFDSIAMRLYELEIEMLVNAINIEPTGVKLTAERPAHRRMSHVDEVRMMRKLKLMIERL